MSTRFERRFLRDPAISASHHLGRFPAPDFDRATVVRDGIHYSAATRLDDVVAAWRLVYDTYRASGLVDPNVHGVHFVPQAIRPASVVGLGRVAGAVRATITAYADGPPGLPLDQVYPDELGRFRAEGRLLVEVGLLADRTSDRARGLDTTLSLMRIGFFHAIHIGATDLVIGVHPHHARFYERLFGFDRFGAPSTCPIVNDAPVVGLRLDLADRPMPEPMPKGLRFFRDSPLSSGFFDVRLRLSPAVIRRTVLEDVLNEKASAAAAAVA